MLQLPLAARAKGVATHSSGNHAAALALAASHFDIPAYIVMPRNAAASKVAAVRAYGGQITFCEPTQAARESELATVCAATDAAFIPPYDHAHVIAGQGTTALEIAEQMPVAPDFLITPVGGGGLLAGCAVASRALLPNAQVIGAEPAGADDALRSLKTGIRQPQNAPNTVADGLRTGLGEMNFSLIVDHVADILTSEDSTILRAMRIIWTRMKLIVEPSAAVGLAVILDNPQRFAGKRVAVVLTGGNVDIDKLPW